MEIITIPCGIIQTNAYLLHNGKDAVLVDAPDSSFQLIKKELDKNELSLQALLITHGHWDHILGAGEFQKEGCPVWAHKDSEELLKDPLSLIPAQMDFQADSVSIDRFLEDGEKLELLGETLLVSTVPGHCPGSLLFHFSDSSVCFTGDLIFLQSVGRTDLPGGDSDELIQSIRKKIYTLPDKTVLYPGHGTETSVGFEKHNNMFVQE